MTGSRAVLVSDNRLFRDGIRQMVEKCHIDIVAESCGIEELLKAPESEAEPELVIFHFASDQRSDSAAASVRDLHNHFAKAKLVILADQCTRPMLPTLLHADVDAILFTQISSELLERSLELVLSGHRLFPADIMAAITGEAGAEPAGRSAPAVRDDEAVAPPEQAGALPADQDQAPPLSRREYQVVQCLAVGLSNKTIARRLHITEGTVKVHVKGLLRKLRAANRTQLAIWALRQSHTHEADSRIGLDAEPRRAI
jgi:two-component system, NarL family, nitrate/nitrite response regulator NarL